MQSNQTCMQYAQAARNVTIKALHQNPTRRRRRSPRRGRCVAASVANWTWDNMLELDGKNAKTC